MMLLTCLLACKHYRSSCIATVQPHRVVCMAVDPWSNHLGSFLCFSVSLLPFVGQISRDRRARWIWRLLIYGVCKNWSPFNSNSSPFLSLSSPWRAQGGMRWIIKNTGIACECRPVWAQRSSNEILWLGSVEVSVWFWASIAHAVPSPDVQSSFFIGRDYIWLRFFWNEET